MPLLKSLKYGLTFVALVFFLLPSGSVRGSDPLDWPNWRGPRQDRISLETGLADDWNPRGGEGSNVVWKRSDLGGISSPIVLNGKLYTIVRNNPGTAEEGEKVVCVDAATGENIWESAFNVYLSDVPDTRVGWSSCVGDPETGNIYALGVCGHFQCLDGETGKTLWSHSLHEQYGLLSTYGGRTNVPVLFEDLVIISAVVIGWGDMAKPAHRFLAFDKKTGQLIWFTGTRLLPYDTTYSTPTVAVIGGQASLVFGSGDGAVWGLQPRTGKGIWKYQFSRRGLNVSPLVSGDRVYTGQSEENIDDTTMGAMVAIDPTADGPAGLGGEKDITQTGEIWRNKQIMVGKVSPIMVDDTVIAIDDRATMMGFDAESGERRFKKNLGTVMRSSPLYADGKIYVCTANGRWYTLRLDGDRVKILHKMRLPSGENCYGSPIVSHGRLYVPTTDNLYCIADSNKKANHSEPAATAQETPVSLDPIPAYVQVVPAEALLKPGETQQFQSRIFNRAGQRLKNVPAQFSLDGSGTITSDGLYTADAGDAHTASAVTAKVGDLTGRSRIRVVPDFPWHFDFEGKTVPITWVGARYRHQLRKFDDDQVMVKVSTIPKGARSRAWMGHPKMSNYTIEADIRGSKDNDKMPDIGLIAQRYTLDLMGASQKLQIRSWGARKRMAKEVKFPWQPDVWYHMKFRAEVVEVDGQPQARLRGKVWPRDGAEPEAWTIEAVDTSPNVNGSPGLYGNAKNTELYLDNLTVSPND